MLMPCFARPHIVVKYFTQAKFWCIIAVRLYSNKEVELIFEYDKEFETLKFISSSGMVQAVHLSVVDLEKLYFMLWHTLQDKLEVEHEI